MRKYLTLILLAASLVTVGYSQSKVMTPEQLIQLNRVSSVGLTDDGAQVIYKTSTFDLSTNERTTRAYAVSVRGGSTEGLLMEGFRRLDESRREQSEQVPELG